MHLKCTLEALVGAPLPIAPGRTAYPTPTRWAIKPQGTRGSHFRAQFEILVIEPQIGCSRDVPVLSFHVVCEGI